MLMTSAQSTPRAGSFIGYMLSLADFSQRTFSTRLSRFNRAFVVAQNFSKKAVDSLSS